jgi:membrane protein DedA with SNARE-associated domain
MSIISFLDAVENFVMTILQQYPLIGPCILLFLEEAGVPLPIPGDVYISYTGYEISRGNIAYPVAFAALLVSILAGSSLLYFLASLYGKNLVIKFGKYIHLNEKKLNYIEKKFRQYGPWVIIIGRHIPGFRIPMTVFAGLSDVKFRTFILSETISVIIWIVLFLHIGSRLGTKTLSLFHNNYSFLFLLIIPISLTIITFLFGKFIPESDK